MKRIGLLLLPDFEVMCLTCMSVFELANKKSGQEHYELRVLSENGGNVRTSFGMEVSTHPLEYDFDTLLIGVGTEAPTVSPTMIAFLQKAARSTRRLASVCLGAFALGEAGLLDGRRATTHWRHAMELQRRYPRSRVEMDRIFVNDGGIWTSAGMSAAIDLALGMVENDHGPDLARAVAKGLVIHHRRAGGQSQHAALLDLDAKTDRIQTALAYANRNLRRPLPIHDLARAASLSPRQFTRAFRSETGTSPAKAIEALRLESAKLLLEQGRLPVEVVARETGFGDRERMRRAFIRAYGASPQAVRINAQK